MDFKLESNFQPSGDQPQAIDQLTKNAQAKTPNQVLLGVTGSGKTYTLANVIAKLNLPTLIISHNKTLAGQLYQEFRDFFPKNAVSYFVSYYDYYQPEAYIPQTDTYIEKETDINDEIDKLRLSTTTNLLTRPDCIVVASVSCIYNLGSPVDYAQHTLELVEGQIIEPSTIATRLISLQYQRNQNTMARGNFRVRGEILELWPAYQNNVLRLTFNHNVLKSWTWLDPMNFDPVPQEDETRRLVIYPAKHNITREESRPGAFEQIRTDLTNQLKLFNSQGKILEAHRLEQKVNYDLEMIESVGFVNGIENYSRYFDGRSPGDPPFTLLDYMSHNAKIFNKPNYLTIIDESHITLPQIRGMHHGDLARKKTLVDYGFRLPAAFDNRPLNFVEFQQRTDQTIYVSATPNDYETSLSTPHIAEQIIRPTGLLEPIIDTRPSKGQIRDLTDEIVARKLKGERVLVTTLTKRMAEDLAEYLSDQKNTGTELKVTYLHSDVETLDRSDILDDLRLGAVDVLVGINLLREGLDLPEVSLVAILDADKEGFLRSATSLIQTMGRAARHQEGKVILYADKTTDSMKKAIDEITRRRRIQEKYNKDHNITPTTIEKPIREKLMEREKKEEKAHPIKELATFGWKTPEEINPQALTPEDKDKLIRKLKKLMNEAAKAWDFEKAAFYRDTISRLQL